MAFKASNAKEGFSALAHMDADTLRFALLLRVGPEKDDDDFMKNLSEEERKILEEETKRKKAESRVKPCTIQACKQTEVGCSMAIIERVNIIKAMEKMNATLQENLEEYEVLSAQSNANTIEADALQQTLQVLQHKEKKEIKEKLVAANKLKSSLEAQIQQAESDLAELRNAGSDKPSSGGFGLGASSPERHRSNLPFLNFTLPANEFQRKHTGSYRTAATGSKQWSCCMGEEEDMEGCADDHSVGIKDGFVFKHREAYRPFTVSQSHWKAEHDNKLSSLHRPVSLLANGNKGFRSYDSINGGPDSLQNFFSASIGSTTSPTMGKASASRTRVGIDGGESLVPSSLGGGGGHLHSHTHSHSHSHSSGPTRHSNSAPTSPAPPPASPIIKNRASAHGTGSSRPSTVGSGTQRGRLEQSVSWAPMPALPNSPGGTRAATGPAGLGPATGWGSPTRGASSLPGSPSMRPSTSAWSSFSSPTSPAPAQTTAPISSLLAAPNRSIHTFGQGHKGPQLPCYVIPKDVPPGWEHSHTASLDNGGLVFSAGRAHAMTTQPGFASSLKQARGALDGYENNALGLATLNYRGGGSAKNGKVRVVGEDLSIKRLGGRPLTAQWGPHLVLTSAVSPGTSLEHTCARIV